MTAMQENRCGIFCQKTCSVASSIRRQGEINPGSPQLEIFIGEKLDACKKRSYCHKPKEVLAAVFEVYNGEVPEKPQNKVDELAETRNL